MKIEKLPSLIKYPYSRMPKIFSDKKNIDILLYLAMGMRPKEISQRVWLSDRTIETRIRKMMRVMGCNHYGQLLVEAVRLGIID